MGLNALTDAEIELFIYDRPWLVYQIQNNPDYKDLELLPMRFNMQSYAMPMRKNIDLDFKHKISSLLIELLETKDWQLLLKEYELHQDWLIYDIHFLKQKTGIHIFTDPIFQCEIKMQLIVNNFSIEIVIFHFFKLFGNFA